MNLEQELAQLADPPQGVRLVRADGRVIPLELLYRGRCAGCQRALWHAPKPVYAGELGEGTRLHVDVIPAGSELTIPWYQGPDRAPS